jgi:undecaprenyl-diphosphatase
MPAREALQSALRDIHTPEEARRVVDALLLSAGMLTEAEVRQQDEDKEKEKGSGEEETDPVRNIWMAATSQDREKVITTLLEAARGVASTSGETREALEQALQQATNPEQYGAEDTRTRAPLAFLRAELVKRMSPLQGIDTALFLALNHLPHPPLANRLMYGITSVMRGGLGWMVLLAAAALLDRRRGRQAFHAVAPPLWFATMTVEYPIKSYFRRRRPFRDIVQAIAVGRKPGSFSFPSGHSASAFAGAWLISRHYPDLAALWYALASITAFSRIYLGVHYPGDVLIGAMAGIGLAEAMRWTVERADELEPLPPARSDARPG